MAFWDVFSGNAGRNTAIWGAQNQQAGLDKQLGYINTGATAANKAINSGTTMSLAALNNANTQGRADVNTNYGQGLSALKGGLTAATNVMYRNPSILQGAAGKADAFYAPLGAEANRGYSAYGDAAGVNGAEGQARARENFQAGPGYEFQVDEATNAAVRAANAAGMTASGNTLDAVTRLGSNLADKEFDDYMAHLNPYLTLAPNIAGSRAGIQTQLGQRPGRQQCCRGRALFRLGQGRGGARNGAGQHARQPLDRARHEHFQHSAEPGHQPRQHRHQRGDQPLQRRWRQYGGDDQSRNGGHGRRPTGQRQHVERGNAGRQPRDGCGGPVQESVRLTGVFDGRIQFRAARD